MKNYEVRLIARKQTAIYRKHVMYIRESSKDFAKFAAIARMRKLGYHVRSLKVTEYERTDAN